MDLYSVDLEYHENTSSLILASINTAKNKGSFHSDAIEEAFSLP